MDSYRVRVRNPKSIIRELKESIVSFERGQLKHFISIAAKEKGKYALKDEAIDNLELEPNYLSFNTFSKTFFTNLLQQLQETNYKQVKDCLGIILRDNQTYLNSIINGLKDLLDENPVDDPSLQEFLVKVDRTIAILFSELIDKGFSKHFLSRFFNALFVNSLTQGESFDVKFDEFAQRLLLVDNKFEIIFKIYSTLKVKADMRSIDPKLEIKENLDGLARFPATKEFDNFIYSGPGQFFIKCSVEAPDFMAALKIAKSLLAENVDVVNLGFSDEVFNVASKALVINQDYPEEARFQDSREFLDGNYKVAKDHYLGFVDKLPPINSNPKVQQETKDKIKSAIRYLRLGNQSTEVEHQFINYWIGLEYLFSNYESNNTINRIKEYLVACHSVSYVKRNAFDFHKTLARLRPQEKANLLCFNEDQSLCIKLPELYFNTWTTLQETHPLIAYRAYLLGKTICPQGNTKPQIKDYVEKHQKNLVIHFTRIYRLRNEIIHDAATNTNNESVASNLRYYLTFILNGAIDFLSEQTEEERGIEDYFTINEIFLGNIIQNGWKLDDFLNVKTSIDFIN